MKSKIYVIFATLLFVVPAINTNNDESTVCASGYQESKNVVGLNYSFIETMATTMSNLIYTQYNPSIELPKGRWFGTEGEWKARDFIIENFTKWGLETNEEEIQKTSLLYKKNNFHNINEDLVVNDFTISCRNTSISNSETEIKNWSVQPDWGGLAFWEI